MRLQVLVSTMFQENYNLIEKMKIDSDAVIVNQCCNDYSEELTYENDKILWINTTDRGLSKSRNCAISNSKAEICLIADDDLIYKDKYKQIIIEEFIKNPTIDIITFCVNGIESDYKKYSNKSRKINLFNSMKISSVEIAFRLSKIKEKGIRFNELFGSGAKYYMGEENIFLSECLVKGLKVKYVPRYIADLHLGESTWFEGFNDKYFINKGAVFTAILSHISIILIIQFAVRKRKLYSENFNVITAIKYMLQGRRRFLLDLKKARKV